MNTRFAFKFIALTIVTGLLASCFGGGDENQGTRGSGGEDDGRFESGECEGFCGTEKTDVTVDLAGAQALFTVQSDNSSSGTSKSESGHLIALKDASNVTINTSSPLFAVTNDGIKGILSALDPEGGDAISGLPRLSFVAVSPIGDVFLAFEHSWIYRDSYDDGQGVITIDEYSDPWSPSSPFTCQLYLVDQNITEASGTSGLICVKNGIEINTYDQRTKKIMFDDAGNVYFTAHVPGNWKDLLWKYSPSSGETSEVINANISFRRVLVTGSGGVLYTGNTSVGREDHGGESFFRYIKPTGELVQITSGWWDFVFAPIESKLENGTVSNNYYKGQILFFGPDPQVATKPEWDDSCLFRFDPSATGSARSTKIADCNIDIWNYINFDSTGAVNTMATQRSRCLETKSMMGGGNQPEKILLADKLDGDGLNEIYVVGDIFEKSANEWKCDLCTNGTVSSYCVVSGTLHFEATTASACTTAGGTFTTSSGCFNGQVDKTATGSVCSSTLPTNWEMNHQWCEFSGNAGRDTRASMARVDENYDGANSNRIVRLSANNEMVTNGWAIGNRLAYIAFNSTSGEYELHEVGKTTTLLTGIEVYELMQDPRDSTKWFFNGLRFSDNSYVLGTFNPDASSPSSTLSVESGLTGQIDTLVIVPDL
ncbi:MAG: hypothetical protein HYT76_05210 [Deltaproteobacteria bacterium]|nr:hypothetical protein [Deltaproteobacteria bacterium]